jgi:hypothetical protein
MKQKTINPEALAFLEALLFVSPEGDDGKIELADRTVHDFSDAFKLEVEKFVVGFQEFLDVRDVQVDLPSGHFGHNVFLSLSGAGCGFWDTAETEHLQPLLEEYSGDRHRFEQIDICEDDEGSIDLCILPEFIEDQRRKLFEVTHNILR